MAKQNKKFSKITTRNLLIGVIVALLVLSAGILLFRFFIAGGVNNFRISNSYYGFQLQAPKGWVARENTGYPESNINALLSACKNNKTASQIGAFRFESQKYPLDFGDPGYLPDGISSGAILEVSVGCGPDADKNGSVKNILTVPPFGHVTYISLLNNGLWYHLKEYIYISPTDKSREGKLRADYSATLSKIVSSFKFIPIK